MARCDRRPRIKAGVAIIRRLARSYAHERHVPGAFGLIRSLTINVEHSGKWRSAPIPRRRRRPKGEVSQFARPVRLTFAHGVFLARTGCLPLADRVVTSITCCDVLELVRNDVGLIDEMARILAPGGLLRLRVPATGVLAGVDAYNLMRYLVDTTHRGARPQETSELGWRRHYSRRDLIDMLGGSRFKIVKVERRRLAIAEATNFLAMMLFRWLRPSGDHYRTGKRIANAIQRIEHRLVSPFGSVLEIVAERLPDAPCDAKESFAGVVRVDCAANGPRGDSTGRYRWRSQR